MSLQLKTTLLLISSLLMIVLQSCEKESENENESKISSNGSNNSHHTGQDCMNCHKQSGSGEGWFVVAGSVYNSLKTIAYPNPTVKLYTGPNGTGTLKYTIQGDALGNFFTTASIDFGSGLYPVSARQLYSQKYGDGNIQRSVQQLPWCID